MNLEAKLNSSLNEVLKSCGYVFEVISNNKKQSNIITGTNNQLVPPSIISLLTSSINKFDDILDETVSKLNDSKWCVEQIVDNRQKQEEKKIKEELEKKKRLEEEKKRKEEEDTKAREKAKKEEEERIRKEKEQQQKEEKEREKERDRIKHEEEMKRKQEQQQQQQLKQQLQQLQNKTSISFDKFMSPGFDFNDLPVDLKAAGDIPNPSDILSSIDYKIEPEINNNDKSNPIPNPNDMDVDMNNLLGNNELLLDGLNMSLLDLGEYDNGNSGDLNGEEFDVDSFLNQFGGSD